MKEIETAKVSPEARRHMLWLRSHRMEPGGFVSPTEKYAAKSQGVSDRTIRRYQTELVAAGWIDIVYRYDEQGLRHNRYRLKNSGGKDWVKVPLSLVEAPDLTARQTVCGAFIYAVCNPDVKPPKRWDKKLTLDDLAAVLGLSGARARKTSAEILRSLGPLMTDTVSWCGELSFYVLIEPTDVQEGVQTVKRQAKEKKAAKVDFDLAAAQERFKAGTADVLTWGRQMAGLTENPKDGDWEEGTGAWPPVRIPPKKEEVEDVQSMAEANEEASDRLYQLKQLHPEFYSRAQVLGGFIVGFGHQMTGTDVPVVQMGQRPVVVPDPAPEPVKSMAKPEQVDSWVERCRRNAEKARSEGKTSGLRLVQ